MAESTTLPLTLYMQAASGAQGRGGVSSTTLVLAYLASTGVGTRAPFRPAEIRAWARERLGVSIDRSQVLG